MKKKFYVYIDRLETGKNANEIIYIGKGDESRIQFFERNQKYNRKYLKYGIIREIVLGTYDETFAYEEEIRLIVEHHTFYKDPLASKNACNLRKGGNGIRAVYSYTPEETFRLKSEAHKGKKHSLGCKHTPEQCKAKSDRMKGVPKPPRSVQHKANMSIAKKKFCKNPNFKGPGRGRKGVPKSEEWKKKLRKSRTPEQVSNITAGIQKSFQSNTRRQKSPISIENVKTKLEIVHGNGIQIDELTYKGVAKKARFIDQKHGEWFAYVRKILAGQGHPKNKQAKIKATTLKRHGVENAFLIKKDK